MIIGKVDWFGGLNNKNQSVNNYGFIIPIENHNTEKGIYLHRNDVPQYLQELIEGNKGKGVYVQFDIDTERQRAVNVELITFIGIVNSFKRGGGYIKCEGYPDIHFISTESFNLGEIVYFGIRCNQISNELDAIHLQKVDSSTTDSSIVYKCIQSNNYNLFKNLLCQYVHTISNEESVQLILSKFKILDTFEKKDLLRKLFEQASNIIVTSSELRNIINFYDSESYSKLINIYLELVDASLKQELLNELFKKLEDCNNSERSIYWKEIQYLQKNLGYKNLFWNLAPIEYKKQVIKNKYSSFFYVIYQFNNSIYPYSKAISSSWRELYKLDKLEKKLIRIWNPSGDSFKEAQMISARGAEKLVVEYYKALNLKSLSLMVEDYYRRNVQNQKGF
ncbi:hypothetical protein H1Q63_33610 [Desmonostoc muscorum CCALA 125]|nr:hypothetical protein [Desmonostoc muscorum CCALA 125]